MGVKVLITGNYETDYNRTVVLLDGLKKRDVEIIEYPYKRLTKNIKEQLLKFDRQVDVVLVPSFMHAYVWELKRLLKSPIVFDPLISRYLTKVYDYKFVLPYSPRALKNYFKDYISFHKCDLMFADTEEHKKYFVKKFNISPEKIHILPVGVNDEEFYPIKDNSKKNGRKFSIGFYGSFIPLQGVDKIVETALLLKDHDVEFNLIGSGVESKRIDKLIRKYNLKNINILGRYKYEQLNEAINQFDLCLGIFGDTKKSDLVVPNKVYHYASCGKCFITKESDAIKEVFTHEKNAFFTSEKPEQIAQSILLLKQKPELMNEIGGNARRLMEEQYNSKRIADYFLNAIKTLK